MNFTHLDENGRGRMVDVGQKQHSARRAVATATVFLNAETLQAIQSGATLKGDVLSIAQIAGISAAKRTWEQIPLCHQIPLTGVEIDFSFSEKPTAIQIIAAVGANYNTGVEMEALSAVTTTALTIYDMCKAIQKDITIGEIFLLEKTGGKADYFRSTPCDR